MEEDYMDRFWILEYVHDKPKHQRVPSDDTFCILNAAKANTLDADVMRIALENFGIDSSGISQIDLSELCFEALSYAIELSDSVERLFFQERKKLPLHESFKFLEIYNSLEGKDISESMERLLKQDAHIRHLIRQKTQRILAEA